MLEEKLAMWEVEAETYSQAIETVKQAEQLKTAALALVE